MRHDILLTDCSLLCLPQPPVRLNQKKRCKITKNKSYKSHPLFGLSKSLSDSHMLHFSHRNHIKTCGLVYHNAAPSLNDAPAASPTSAYIHSPHALPTPADDTKGTPYPESDAHGFVQPYLMPVCPPAVHAIPHRLPLNSTSGTAVKNRFRPHTATGFMMTKALQPHLPSCNHPATLRRLTSLLSAPRQSRFAMTTETRAPRADSFVFQRLNGHKRKKLKFFPKKVCADKNSALSLQPQKQNNDGQRVMQADADMMRQ